MDRSFYEIRYTYLKSIEPNFFIMRKINIIVSQTTLCSCRSLSLFIQDWGLVYHFCMVEKLSFILEDMTSLLQQHMNSSSLYINFHLCSFCNEKCTEVQLARKYSSRGKCTFLSAKKWFDLRKFMIPIVEFLQICLFSFTLFLGFFTVGFTNF